MWITIAEAVVGSLSLETIIQAASAGGFAVLAWYLITKVLPEINREHREERKTEQDRWRSERQELLGYITARDARWLEYCEKRDDQFEQQAKEWTAVMIRVETSLQLQGKSIHKGKPDEHIA